jgi:hypothetical protein
MTKMPYPSALPMLPCFSLYSFSLPLSLSLSLYTYKYMCIMYIDKYFPDLEDVDSIGNIDDFPMTEYITTTTSSPS